MVTIKVQEAISLIKAGDRENGRRLLTEVLQEDPKNETAWLWMSTLVSGDERMYCLEKALSINPNNLQVRQKLEQLRASQPSQVQSNAQPMAVNPTPPASQVIAPAVNRQPASMAQAMVVPLRAPVQENTTPQVWLVSGKSLASVVYMMGDNLLAFDVLPDKAPLVASEVQQGITAKQLDELKKKYHLMNVNHVALSKIKEVAWFGSALKFTALDNAGNEKRVRATVDDKNVEAILRSLQERLSPSFKKISRPISRATVMTSALVMFLLTSCVTGFFYWLARGLQTEEGRITGSATARALGNLLLLLGPNGVLCLGGALFLIVVLAMVSSLAKPPQETVLVRG